jgi:hypothetical protein
MDDGIEEVGGSPSPSPHSESGGEDGAAEAARLAAVEVWAPFGGGEDEEGWEDPAGMDDGIEEVGGSSTPSPHSESGGEDGVAEAARLAAVDVWAPFGGGEDEEGWEDAAGMDDGIEEAGGSLPPSSPHSESGGEVGAAEAARLPAEEVWAPFGGGEDEGGWEDVAAGMVGPEEAGGSPAPSPSPQPESAEEGCAMGPDVLALPGEEVWDPCEGEDEDEEVWAALAIRTTEPDAAGFDEPASVVFSKMSF